MASNSSMLAPHSPTLPPEIFEDILSLSLPRSTTLSCSLTNHLLRDLSLKRLFYRVSISTSSLNWGHSRKLLPLLQTNPALHRYVKELKIDLQGFQERWMPMNEPGIEWDENASETFIEILQHIGEVQILSVGFGPIAGAKWMTLPAEAKGAMEELIGSHSLTQLSMSFIAGIPETALRRARNLRILKLEGCSFSNLGSINSDLRGRGGGLQEPIALTSLVERHTRWQDNQGFRKFLRWMSDAYAAAPDSFPFSFRNISHFETELFAELSQPIQGALNSCAETLTSLRLQLVRGK